MNPNLSRLQAYPFERLRQLFAKVNPNPAYRAISLGIGEPRHATPQLVKDAYCAAIQGTGLSGYPATTGELALRQSIAQWLQRRYALALDVATQILPVNGSREALFAFAPTRSTKSTKARLIWQVLSLTLYPRCRRAISRKIGTVFPTVFGNAPNCCTYAHPAIRLAP